MTLPEDNSLRSYPLALPKELKKAEVSCEWIFRVMSKDARELPSRTWLNPTDVASFLENARKKLIEELCDKGFCHNGVGVTDVKGNPHFCRNCKIIVAVFGGERK